MKGEEVHLENTVICLENNYEEYVLKICIKELEYVLKLLVVNYKIFLNTEYCKWKTIIVFWMLRYYRRKYTLVIYHVACYKYSKIFTRSKFGSEILLWIVSIAFNCFSIAFFERYHIDLNFYLSMFTLANTSFWIIFWITLPSLWMKCAFFRHVFRNRSWEISITFENRRKYIACFTVGAL